MSFLSKAEQYSIVRVYLFVCPPIEGQLGYIHHLTIVNYAAMNMAKQVFVYF